MKPPLSQPVEAYVRAINNHDAESFIALFADNAVVDDIGREFRGPAAIKAWSGRDVRRSSAVPAETVKLSLRPKPMALLTEPACLIR